MSHRLTVLGGLRSVGPLPTRYGGSCPPGRNGLVQTGALVAQYLLVANGMLSGYAFFENGQHRRQFSASIQLLRCRKQAKLLRICSQTKIRPVG
ncbi:MAG: hypothetical protein GY820_29040 [Gammaproteobacteria bacterium]|nr:hypothetical protein [Gammaproteobacteria bacterium]